MVIDAGTICIATDPWFDRPACVRATVPWPTFDITERDIALIAIDECSHIYLSHDHEDHFDPVFLRKLAPKTLVVGRFANARFQQEIQALEPYHQVLWMDDGEEVELAPGIVAKMHLEKPHYRVNSILSLRTRDCLILNANDCGTEMRMLDELSAWRKPGESMIFLYTLNLLASGWFFPYCRKGDQSVLPRYLKVKEDVINNWRRLIEVLSPTVSVCYAGPLSMVDPVNSFINDLPHARDNTALVEEIRAAGDVVWPAPFSVIQFDHQLETLRNLRGWTEFLARPAVPVGFVVDTHFEQEIAEGDLLQQAIEFQAELVTLQKRLSLTIRPRLVFALARSFADIEETSMQRLLIDPSANGERPRFLRLGEAVAEPWFQVNSTAAMVSELFQNTIPWDSFYGGRARLSRKPDAFDQALHLMLNFGRDPLGVEVLDTWLRQRTIDSLRAETIIREVNGRKIQMLRYCPHEGEDLSMAPILDGRVVCPRHRWEFDASTGKCVRGDLTTSLCIKAVMEVSE